MIGPIQNRTHDAIGVISFTDVDLFTKSLSNFCFGYGIPSLGGVQSLYRFLPHSTGEEYDNDEEFESWTMMRIVKIATHEIGHMYGHGHCIHYQCLMMGTMSLEQTDKNPITFCPVCYRKLWKCLKFDHVARYKALSECSKKLGVAFNEPQEYEMNEMSVTEWFEKRYQDLKKKIDPSDYGTSDKNFRIEPIRKDMDAFEISSRALSPPKLLKRRSNTPQKEAVKHADFQPVNNKKTFLKRGEGNAIKKKLPPKPKKIEI